MILTDFSAVLLISYANHPVHRANGPRLSDALSVDDIQQSLCMRERLYLAVYIYGLGRVNGMTDYELNSKVIREPSNGFVTASVRLYPLV